MSFQQMEDGGLKVKEIQDTPQSLTDRVTQSMQHAKFQEINNLNCLFMDPMDEFENETLMAMTHFHQEAKALVFSPL